MIGRSRRKRRGEVEELNVTAFMNLMVVLVPFLLITAVFSRLTILQLNLPGDAAATTELEPDTAYDVVVQVMDAVRAVTLQQDGKWMQAELFPDISVGDAPDAAPLPNAVPTVPAARAATPRNGGAS